MVMMMVMVLFMLLVFFVFVGLVVVVMTAVPFIFAADAPVAVHGAASRKRVADTDHSYRYDQPHEIFTIVEAFHAITTLKAP